MQNSQVPGSEGLSNRLTLVAQSISGLVVLPKPSMRAMLVFSDTKAAEMARGLVAPFLYADLNDQAQKYSPERIAQINSPPFNMIKTDNHTLVEVPYNHPDYQWLDILTQLADDKGIPRREIHEMEPISYKKMNELCLDMSKEYEAKHQR